jgi:hypothetical protein
MNNLQKALQDFREQAPFQKSLDPVRRQMLVEAGLTAGEIDRCLKADPGKAWDKEWAKLAKGQGGYRSLVKSMLSKGYTKERIMEMLGLEDYQYWDFSST